jgi:hypothetical protein
MAAVAMKPLRVRIIVGGAVLAHAVQHPAFAHELEKILQTAVARQSDRDTIRDLITG